MKRALGFHRRKICWGLAILVATAALITPKPTPVWAESGKTNLAIGASIIGVIGTAAIGYGIWENLPQNQGKPRYFNGEFYAGGFGGESLLHKADWAYDNLTTAQKVAMHVGAVGGLKFGYFTASYPWLGLEAETNFTRQDVWNQTISISPTVGGSHQGTLPTSHWYVYTNSLKIMGRYGFFPDSEVPFGRLQPYLGIGPGFVVIYSEADSAKNFSLEVEAGLRYLMLKNVSAFVEYKFSQQWNVLLESQTLYAAGAVFTKNATFDVTNHKFVLGVAYHF